MKLLKLKKLIDHAVKEAGGVKNCDVDVEIFTEDETYYEIKSMGQFGFVQDVTITIAPIE